MTEPTLAQLSDDELEARFVEAEHNALQWIGVPGRNAEHQSARWMAIAQACRAELARRADGGQKLAPPEAPPPPARPRPALFDADGALRFVVAEATTRDEDLELRLAAEHDGAEVGLALLMQQVTGKRVYHAGALRSLGSASDALVAALARAWRRPVRAMAPEVPCWIWPPRDRITGARAYTARDLSWMDVELSLQVLARKSERLAWWPLGFAGDAGQVVLRPVPDERRLFLELVTGQREAVLHPD